MFAKVIKVITAVRLFLPFGMRFIHMMLSSNRMLRVAP